MVSSSAFERHGEICECIRQQLFVRATVTVSSSRSVETESRRWHQTGDRKPIQRLREWLLEDPFSGKTTHRVPDPATEEEIPCNACAKSGQVQCYDCNGNGREKCRKCDGTKFRTESQRCPICDGDSGNGDCPKCDGSGQLTSEVPCSHCDAKGHTRCHRCSGTGVTDCENCDGNGFLWQFEAVYFDLTRNIQLSETPSWWGESNREFANEIDWSEDDIHIQETAEHRFTIRTRSSEAVYVRLMFGDDSYNAAVIDRGDQPTVVWDPETSYPRTSIRRKLSDLKSRVFW